MICNVALIMLIIFLIKVMKLNKHSAEVGREYMKIHRSQGLAIWGSLTTSGARQGAQVFTGSLSWLYAMFAYGMTSLSLLFRTVNVALVWWASRGLMHIHKFPRHTRKNLGP